MAEAIAGTKAHIAGAGASTAAIVGIAWWKATCFELCQREGPRKMGGNKVTSPSYAKAHRIQVEESERETTDS